MSISKPFLKWAGGKYKLSTFISENIPKKMYSRLVEPFAGSMAFSLTQEYDEYLINDINTDLINLYLVLKDKRLDFITFAKSYFTGENNTELKFYEFREEFNKETDIVKKSALFIYLNRHAFNGLCRYNSKGGFNVPFGRFKTPYFPEKEMIHFLTRADRMEFMNVGFHEIFKLLTSDDLIYCDPPYVPLTETASFTSYYKDGFGAEQQIELAKLAKDITQKYNNVILISNHDLPFTRDLYKESRIETVQVQRNIAAKGASRNKVGEILAIFNGTSK